MSNDLLAAAKRYHDMGLNILPVGGKSHKQPLVKSWKPYQKTRMTLPNVLSALERPDATGIGIITGPTSGNLYVRDFDESGAYQRWADAHRALADTLPTESTGREDGRHVFFRHADTLATTKHHDGELRGADAFTVIAPSIHASGKRYKWIRPLVSLDDVPFQNPTDFFSVEGITDTEDTEDTETHNTSCVSAYPVYPASSVSSVSDEIESALLITQPTTTGQRQRMLFNLARRLKAIDAAKPAKQWMDAVRAWHTKALPKIATKEWAVTWGDFVIGYSKVRHAHGQGGALQAAASRAFADDVLATVPKDYDSLPMRKLYALCRDLGTGGQVFYLSCRTAGELIGTDHDTAARFIRFFTLMGVLVVTTEADRPRRKATFYAFIAPT